MQVRVESLKLLILFSNHGNISSCGPSSEEFVVSSKGAEHLASSIGSVAGGAIVSGIECKGVALGEPESVH